MVPVQSVPITTKYVSSNTIHGVVYSIQHYMTKFVRVLWIFPGIRFPQSINLTATI
jgi:RecG-like helicase